MFMMSDENIEQGKGSGDCEVYCRDSESFFDIEHPVHHEKNPLHQEKNPMEM